MVQESRELAGRIEAETPQYKTGAKLLADFAASLGKQRLLPSSLPGVIQETQHGSSRNETVVAPELNLDAEWQRQSGNFLRAKFHIAARFPDTEEGKQAYLDTLPKFEPQPEDYKGRFSLPLLVETRKPWEELAAIAGIAISDYLRSRINQTKPHNNRSQTPETPYTGWFNRWGERFPQKVAPKDAQMQLAADEVGGGPHEGVAMQVAHPQTTKEGKYFDLIGYNVGSDGVPYLYHWGGGPRLAAGWFDFARDDFRPLVRGSKIVTK